MSRTMKIYVFALAAMAFSLLCNAQSPTAVAAKLYEQIDQSWAKQDVNQVFSFFDPGAVLIDEKGKRTGVAEIRKALNDSLTGGQVKNFSSKTTIKDVQLQGGRMVVYSQTQLRYQVQDKAAGWHPLINTASGEDTWEKKGDQWKVVLSHTQHRIVGFDPAAK